MAASMGGTGSSGGGGVDPPNIMGHAAGVRKSMGIEPKTDMDRVLLGRTKDFKELRVGLKLFEIF